MIRSRLLLTTCIALLFFAFVKENPFYHISAEDVRLKIPKGFPDPVYAFKNNTIEPAVFVLGRTLFYDNLLSRDQTINCGTCHQRFAAFAHIDHRLSHGIYARIGTRNVPALQNLIWKKAFMWDGGVNHLEVQPLNPLTNPAEMDEDLPHLLSKLRADTAYVSRFRNAFGDTAITTARLLKALAQFTGLMISSNARYDLYLQKKESFTEGEKAGLALFRKKCASCHAEPLFSDNAYHDTQLAADTALKDLGRARISGNSADAGKFMTPSLRNVVQTYPYMHDGRFRNLQEVLRHYGQLNPATTKDPHLQAAAGIAVDEQEKIILFLQTLSDKTFLYDRRFAPPPGYQ